MRDLARLAIAAFGRAGQGSGVIGVDVQRIRRALGLRSEPQHELPEDDPRREGVPRDALRHFEALLRRELERRQIERTQALPAPCRRSQRARPRAPCSGPLQDLAAVHRVVATLRTRLKRRAGASREPPAAAHETSPPHHARASLQTGGVPVQLKYRPIPPAPAGDLRAVRHVEPGVASAWVCFLSCCTRCMTRSARSAVVRLHRAHLGGSRRILARA